MLVEIILAFVLLSARLARVRYAPTVQNVFSDVDGQKVTTAAVGSEVKAHVVTKATEERTCRDIERLEFSKLLLEESVERGIRLLENVEPSEENWISMGAGR